MRVILLIMIVFVFAVTGCQTEQDSSQQMMPKPGQPVPDLKAQVIYTVPQGWESQTPRGRMRKAQLRIPGQNGAEDAEMAVFVFPGSGGQVQANLERWYAQFSQPDGTGTADKARVETMEVNDLKVTKVYVTGIFNSSMGGGMKSGFTGPFPDYAMLACVVETPQDPWFFKAVGPQATIDASRPAFDRFVSSFQYQAVE